MFQHRTLCISFLGVKRLYSFRDWAKARNHSSRVTTTNNAVNCSRDQVYSDNGKSSSELGSTPSCGGTIYAASCESVYTDTLLRYWL